MALQAHTIYSYYSPPDSDLTCFDGEDDEATSQDKWTRAQALAGPSKPSPSFVPAQIQVDEFGRPLVPTDTSQDRNQSGSQPVSITGSAVSSWYHHLSRKRASPYLPSSAVSPPPTGKSPPPPIGEPSTSLRETDWFSSFQYAISPAVSETIAERLERDPPSTVIKKPKVWIALGPSNKGYEMLTRSGWNEGQGLGPRLDTVSHPETSKTSKREIQIDRLEHSNIIDLTEEDESENIFESGGTISTHTPASRLQDSYDYDNTLPSGGTALLTPLATTLKSDRLGIGLHTEYVTTSSGMRIPKRRVTHGEKALASHSRTMEEQRRMREKWGKGAKGHKRKKNAEEKTRRQLLAYMNT